MNAVQKVCLVLSFHTRAHFQKRKATVRQDTTLILGAGRRVSNWRKGLVCNPLCDIAL